LSIANHDLSPGLLAWLETLGKGHISHLERHVARREAWVVDIAAADGSVLEGFLRLDRQPVADGNVSLRREAGICQALMRTTIPVPALLGWNEEHHAALFSRVPGSADLPGVADRAQQRQVMEDFIDTIARLHRLDLDSLALDDLLGPRPKDAAEAALGDLDAQLQQFAGFLADYEDPLLSYGADWLRRFVPQSVARVSLVQGDTGPVNFMFEDNRVTAVVDWEWGHWGDPMEDLGNICVREFWNPSGGLQGLFRRYEEQSGIPYTRAAAQYYRIQQNVRGMIPIHAACAQPGLRESMAWYLCYRYIGDRSTCEALGDAMGIELERPLMPDADTGSNSILLRAAAKSLQRDVLPELQTPFARSRMEDTQVLLECAEREHRYGAAIRADNAVEIARLLGQQPADYARATTRLLEAMRERHIADEPLLQYLARKAYRDEWLYQPAASLYPTRSWSALD